MLHTLPIFHLISNLLRVTGGYHGFEAHQDWSAVQTSINSVAVWLPNRLGHACSPRSRKGQSVSVDCTLTAGREIRLLRRAHTRHSFTKL